MLWPTSASSAIKTAFYDKSFTVSTDTVEMDAEGGIKPVAGVKRQCMGNVRFNDLGQLQTELGLTESIAIAVTCSPTTKVSLNDTLTYGGKQYKVFDVIPADSHLTVVGKL